MNNTFDPKSPVREQYEELPYPPRDPGEERHRLMRTWLDELPMINHYCFAGRQSFGDHFRALVAGGGTGDATIFLAEQLRDTNAEIVHLDFSRASIDIARQRAQIRGLDKISWVHGSILALADLGLGQFDYVNCSGVLHHLEDPDAGLRALLAVLKEHGALGIMVYGQYGRTGVYQMQSLMRLINEQAGDSAEKILNTREILAALPQTNWFKRGGASYYQDNEDLATDAGIFDLLLHSQDRAYTVAELYGWLHDLHGLHIEFSDVGRGRSPYLPQMVLGPHRPRVLDAVLRFPLRRQHEIAELLGGNLLTHSFYASRTAGSGAPYGAPDYVPFFIHEPVTGNDLAALIRHHHHRPFLLKHAHTGISVHVDPGEHSARILQHIDGRRTFGEIFALVRRDLGLNGHAPGDAELFADFRNFFDVLNSIDRVLLRHPTASV